MASQLICPFIKHHVFHKMKSSLHKLWLSTTFAKFEFMSFWISCKFLPCKVWLLKEKLKRKPLHFTNSAFVYEWNDKEKMSWRYKWNGADYKIVTLNVRLVFVVSLSSQEVHRLSSWFYRSKITIEWWIMAINFNKKYKFNISPDIHTMLSNLWNIVRNFVPKIKWDLLKASYLMLNIAARAPCISSRFKNVFDTSESHQKWWF